MTSGLKELRLRMEAASEAGDFEQAARLRDQLSLLRDQPDANPTGDMDTSRLKRQQPGKMGLGTSDQVMTPPAGWRPPPKPDNLTANQRPARRRRR